jgi:hypothetical protein
MIAMARIQRIRQNGTSSTYTTNVYSNSFGGNTAFNLDEITHPDITNYELNKTTFYHLPGWYIL